MYYELALISVLVAGGYWGWYFVRHDALRTYGMMLITSAALAGLGLLGRHYDDSGLGVAGAIGVGAGTCLLVLGPLARGLARRAAAAERFKIAERLLDIADVLAPGSGITDEKALLGAMREIRDGNIEQTVEALVAAKQRAPAEARLAIDERIAMLYLAAYRWDDAIAHAEENLFGAVQPPSDAAASPAVALRRALGVAPPVWVELLGAYGYKGDLEQAARMLARLEDVCAGREDAAIWVHRGRMMFLALAGRVDAVQTLVEPRRSRHMSPSARAYWVAVALERRGEAAAAEAAYGKARARSRGRPRMLIDQALARLPNARPAELGAEANEVVARVEAAAPPTVLARPRPRGPVATRVLAVTLIAVSATIALTLGDSSDVGVLMRDGAMVRELVSAGEWWRLVTAVFVHVGDAHLILNVVGLWFIGRVSEELFGGWRTACIFALAGIAGAAATFLASPAGVSAGASGAIFGLLGAVFVELTLHRKRHRTAWNRGVWGSLAVVTVAQVGIGFFSPGIDQWAHGGGLAAGALAGALLSPHVRWARGGLRISRVVTIAFAVVAVLAAVLVARTSITNSLYDAPRALHHIGAIVVKAPASWQVEQDDERGGVLVLFDDDLSIQLEPHRQSIDNGTLAVQLAMFDTKRVEEERRGPSFEQIDQAGDRAIPLPAGWEGQEHVVTVTDPLGGRQRFRLVIAGHVVGNSVVIASLYVPETIARKAHSFFTELLDQVH